MYKTIIMRLHASEMYKEAHHICKAVRSTVKPTAHISPLKKLFVKITFGEYFVIRKVL